MMPIPTRPEVLLVDSGFFFALFDPRDPHHAAAVEKQEWIETLSLAVPWPILYETFNTRFARRAETIGRFESIIRRADTELLDDAGYRDAACEEALMRARRGYGPISLVDSVLCAILMDVNVRISAMLTFNERDFASLCASRGIELL